MRPILPLALLAAAAAAVPAAAQEPPAPQARLDQLLAGRTAGPARQCLPLNQVTRTEIVTGVGVAYSVGRRLFLNRPAVGAGILNRNDILTSRTSTTRLCAGEPLQVIERTGFVGKGFVTLGAFTPYERAARR